MSLQLLPSLVQRAMPALRGASSPLGHRLLPLAGVSVVELAGLAPVPHCGLVLADFGASVTLVERENDPAGTLLVRGKKSLQLDLKKNHDIQKVKEMCRTADVLLDPFRPGVLEKLGLDPVKLIEANSSLIVCRLTGFGQDGPLSKEAGHDINYAAISGILPTVAGHGRRPPWPPANLLADFAGGGLTAAFGVVAALFQRTANGGKGCILDVSMVEGLSYLSTFITMYKNIDYLWNAPFAAFGSECPIYRCYETSDGKFMSVGALEPKFSANLLKVLGVNLTLDDIMEKPAETVATFEKTFKTKTRDEWAKIFEGKDACVAPVLEMEEVGEYHHHRSRDAFVRDDCGRWIPRPHPRFYSVEENEEHSKKSKL